MTNLRSGRQQPLKQTARGRRRKMTTVRLIVRDQNRGIRHDELFTSAHQAEDHTSDPLLSQTLHSQLHQASPPYTSTLGSQGEGNLVEQPHEQQPQPHVEQPDHVEQHDHVVQPDHVEQPNVEHPDHVEHPHGHHVAGNSSAGSVSSTNGRTEVRIIEPGEYLDPSRLISRHMGECFKLKQFQNGHSWKGFTVAEIDYFWMYFKDKFFWNNLSDTVIKELWKEKTRKRYNDFIHRLKLKFRDNPKDTTAPAFVSQAIWDVWIQKWSSEESIEASRRLSANRRAEPWAGAGPARHTGGSKSYREHAVDLQKGKDTPITEIEIFERTHRKDKGRGDWVDERSRKISEDYHKLVADRLSHLSSQQEPGSSMVQLTHADHRQLYYDVVGGSSKKRKRRSVYGLGSQSQASVSYPSETGCGSWVPKSFMDSEIGQIKKDLEQQKERFSDQQKRISAQQKRLSAQQTQLAKLMRIMVKRHGEGKRLVEEDSEDEDGEDDDGDGADHI